MSGSAGEPRAGKREQWRNLSRSRGEPDSSGGEGTSAVPACRATASAGEPRPRQSRRA